MGRVEKAIGRVAFSLELKYDGVAISLSYRNGSWSAVTRGDGVEGEDITPPTCTVRAFPETAGCRLAGGAGGARRSS